MCTHPGETRRQGREANANDLVGRLSSTLTIPSHPIEIRFSIGIRSASLIITRYFERILPLESLGPFQAESRWLLRLGSLHRPNDGVISEFPPIAPSSMRILEVSNSLGQLGSLRNPRSPLRHSFLELDRNVGVSVGIRCATKMHCDGRDVDDSRSQQSEKGKSAHSSRNLGRWRWDHLGLDV